MPSFNLILRSFRVLSRDKRLVIFPILSTLAAVAISVPFFLAVFATGGGDQQPWTPARFALLFVWYCCANFAMVFFNCALAAGAQTLFNGGEPSLGEGISQAAGRTPSILMWAVVSSTVGVILRWLDERTGIVGRIAIAVFGIGWTMATYLIVPVLVIENRGVMESIKRSGELLRNTWGEQIVGAIAFGWVGILLAIPGVVLGAIGMNGFAPMIPVAVLYFVALFAAVSAARQIFSVALYRYATIGDAPEGYTADGLRAAIRQR